MKNPERIREAAKDPRFRGVLHSPNFEQTARNRLCGDELRVQILLEDDRVSKVLAQVQGCLVTQAAWTITAQAVEGLPRAEAICRLTNFVDFLDGQTDEAPDAFAELSAFQRPSPRRDCARLGAQALANLLAFEQNATGSRGGTSAEVSASPKP